MTGHETVKSYKKISISSDRTFGLLFAGLFMFGAAIEARGNLLNVNLIVITMALLFGLSALLKPNLLAPFNLLWFKLGMVIHKITTPIIMAFLFFIVLLPFSLVLKAFGKDLLRLQPSSAESYWIIRNPTGPARGAMDQQF